MKFKTPQQRAKVMASFHKRHPMDSRVNKTVVKQSLNDLRIAKSQTTQPSTIKELNSIESQLRTVASGGDRDKLISDIRDLQEEQIPRNTLKRLESIKRNIDSSGAFSFGKNDSELHGGTDYSDSMRNVINKKEGIRTKKEKPEDAQMRWIFRQR